MCGIYASYVHSIDEICKSYGIKNNLAFYVLWHDG